MGFLLILLRIIFCIIPTAAGAVALWGLINDDEPKWTLIGPAFLAVSGIWFALLISEIENGGAATPFYLMVYFILLIIAIVGFVVYARKNK